MIKPLFNKLAPRWDFLHVLVYAAICLLAFVPYMCIFHPGIVEVDTSFQIAMSLGYGYGTVENYASPFPVFDIRLLGALYALGEMIWNDATGGIWAICLFQCIGLALAVSLIACYLSKWHVPAWVRLTVFAFFALVPIVPLVAVDVGKDTVFCVFFVPFALCTCEYVRRTVFEKTADTNVQQGGESARLKKKSNVLLAIYTIVFGSLSFLVVSKGIVIVLACILIAFFLACKKSSKPLMKSSAAAFGGCLAVQIVFSLVLSPIMSVGLPDSSSFLRESFGTPIQQATWVAKVNGQITDSERAALEEFYDLDAATEHYLPDTSDNSKMFVKPGVGMKDAAKFLVAYATIGLSHPKEYAKSFVDLYDGFWQVGTVESLMLPRFMPEGKSDSTLDWKDNMFRVPVQDIDGEIEAIQRGWLMYSHGNLPEYKEQHPEFGDWPLNEENDQARKDVLTFVMEIGKIPVLNLFVSKSLYVLYLPLLLLLAVIVGVRKPYRSVSVLLLAPLGFSCIFAFLSPADLARYAYPCLMLCPLYLALVGKQHIK